MMNICPQHDPVSADLIDADLLLGNPTATGRHIRDADASGTLDLQSLEFALDIAEQRLKE
jgi:hypothetical protein